MKLHAITITAALNGFVLGEHDDRGSRQIIAKDEKELQALLSDRMRRLQPTSIFDNVAILSEVIHILAKSFGVDSKKLDELLQERIQEELNRPGADDLGSLLGDHR
jgi:hypothetical protein